MISPAQPRMTTGMLHAFRPVTARDRLVPALLAVVVFAIAFLHYNGDVKTTAFHPDESRWLNRAHYLEDLLDPFGTTWNDQYLTRGQPPMGSYVMGAGLLAQGSDADTNRAWDYRRTGDWNVQNGMYPSQDDLHTGRRTNVFLGALAVAVTFLAVRLLSNTAGGLVGAAILTFHPLQAWHNRLALADTTLTLSLATLVLTLVLLARRPGWFKALAAGILIGIGGANKLTPMALAFVVAAAGGVLLIWTIWRNARSRLRSEPWHHLVPGIQHLSWMLISAPIVAGATFIAAYPYLWKHPIVNTLLVLDFRQNEMDMQARLYPQFAVETTGEAIRKTWASLADRWSATEWVLGELGLERLAGALSPLDVVLAMIGAVLVAILAAQMPFRSGHLLVFIILIVQVATIVLAMRTDFERYYLPIVLTTAVFAGAGVGIASQTAWHLARVGRSRPALPPASPLPARGREVTDP